MTETDLGRMTLDEIQERIGHRFSDVDLLQEAVTHASARGSGASRANERLAFLGDAVLGLVAAEKVFNQSNGDKGLLTEARKQMVKNETLADLAKKNGLERALVLGRGEENRGREKESIQATLIEAILGAVFRDKDYETARAFVRRLQS
jgi:ribonuclease III